MKTILAVLTLILASIACTNAAPQSTIAAPQVKGDTQTPQNATQTVSLSVSRVTAASAVNVRNQPSEHGDWLGYKYSGDVVTVIECVGKWARIGDGQYVNGRYIDNGVCQ